MDLLAKTQRFERRHSSHSIRPFLSTNLLDFIRNTKTNLLTDRSSLQFLILMPKLQPSKSYKPIPKRGEVRQPPCFVYRVKPDSSKSLFPPIKTQPSTPKRNREIKRNNELILQGENPLFPISESKYILETLSPLAEDTLTDIKNEEIIPSKNVSPSKILKRSK